MNQEAVQSLVAYNDWANDRILEALVAMPAEDIVRPIPGSFACLRDTWAHLVMAEWLWLWRWQGQPPATLPEWVATANLEQLNRALLEVRQRRQELLAAISETELAAKATYGNLARDKEWKVTVGQMLAHVVNHSTYHRGQITTMMRQLGKHGPATDFLIFVAL